MESLGCIDDQVLIDTCNIGMQVKDEDGRLMNDFTGRVKREEWTPPAGLRRTVTVALDSAQYQLDMEDMQAGSPNMIRWIYFCDVPRESSQARECLPWTWEMEKTCAVMWVTV